MLYVSLLSFLTRDHLKLDYFKFNDSKFDHFKPDQIKLDYFKILIIF